MKIYIVTIIVILAVSAATTVQTRPAKPDITDLPIEPLSSALVGRKKVHINADDGDWEMIANELEGKNGFIVVDEPEEAEFYLSYFRTSMVPEGGPFEGILAICIRNANDPEIMTRQWQRSSSDLKDKKHRFQLSWRSSSSSG